MKMKKWVIILLIMIAIIAMPISLSACGGRGNNGNDDGPPIVPPPEPEIIQNIFTYNYNEATGNNTEKEIELNPEDYLQTRLVVPIREKFEFDGWYSDWLFKTRVSDNQGEIVIGEELFENKSKQLYAKWKNDNAPIYPVLMVFVTEVDAELQATNGEMIKVDYSMTSSERKVCEMIAPMLEEYLNAMMNGAVYFKLDSYFTSEVVGTRSFIRGIGQSLGGTDLLYNYDLPAYTIPELGGMEKPEVNGFPPIEKIEGDGLLSKYRTIMTTFSMNDHEDVLHFIGGSSERKYSSIHLETLFSSLIKQGYTVDDLFDPYFYKWWKFYMEVYVHEFTHSVELYLENKIQNELDYHEIKKQYALKYGYGYVGQSGAFEIEISRLFLLGKAEIEGEFFGVRHNFWNFDKI